MPNRLLRYTGVLVLGISLAAISGCGSVPKNAGFHEVERTVETRIGEQIHWRQEGEEDPRVADSIHEMIQDKLSIDEAVQIALLQNSSLQATFEELGIAQADLIQAGLLENPVFSGHVRFPDDSDEGANTEFAITQNFMDLLLVPIKKKVAAEQFKEVELRVSEAVWHLSMGVREAYFTLQGLEHTHAMLETVLQTAEAAEEFANRQSEAGNINILDLASEQASFEEARLDLLRNETEVIEAQEKLNKLMGFSEKPSWKISDKMLNIPSSEPPVEELEAKALSQNLELAIIQQEIQVLERNLTLSRRGIISAIDVGLNTEKDPDGTRVTGPMFDVELPVFDRKQATVARVEAQLRQSRHLLKNEEARVLSEIRSAWRRLKIARQLVERYREKIIPLREKIVAESQKHYNFMLIGVFQLLQAKREEINAYQKYIEAFQSYWMIRTDLEKVVGVRLLFSEKEILEPSKPAVSSQDSHTHHHGGHS